MSDLHFPSLYRDTDRKSITGQKLYIWLTAAGLALAIAAAYGGAINQDMNFNGKVIHLGGLLAMIAFGFGAIVSGLVVFGKPERMWYQGRAAAESIKTMSWQYMVRGGIFGSENTTAETLFRERLGEIVKATKSVRRQPPARDQLDAKSVGDDQLTPEMRRIRALSLDDRRAHYLTYRLRDQEQWYGRSAVRRMRLSWTWLGLAILLQIIGFSCGIVAAFGSAPVSLLGLFATGAASASAWVQTRDHQNLAATYLVTHEELLGILLRAEDTTKVVTEEEWAAFVGSTEQAISREHTLWLARRGMSTVFDE